MEYERALWDRCGCDNDVNVQFWIYYNVVSPISRFRYGFDSTFD